MPIKLDATVRHRLNSIAPPHKRTSRAIAREAIEIYVARKEARSVEPRHGPGGVGHCQVAIETAFPENGSVADKDVDSYSPACTSAPVINRSDRK